MSVTGEPNSGETGLEALDRPILDEQQCQIFLHNLMVLNHGKREKYLLCALDLAQSGSWIERFGEVVVREVPVELKLAEFPVQCP